MKKSIFWILYVVLMAMISIANILSIKGMGPHALPDVMVFANGAFILIGLILGSALIIAIVVIAFIVAIGKGEKLTESFFKKIGDEKKGRRKKEMN